MKTPRSPRSKPPIRLKDVAAAAGVSLATASLARRDHPSIAPETRHRVREAEKRLGYQPPERQPREAATRRRRQCRNLLYCVIDYPLRQSQYADFLNGVMEACQERKIRLQLRALRSDDPLDKIATLHDGVDGLLLTGEVRPLHQTHFATLPIPALMLGNYQPLGLPAVELHLPRIAHALAERIAKEGHRHIAHLLHDPENYYEHAFLSWLQSELATQALPPPIILQTSDEQDALLAAGAAMLKLTPPITAFTSGSASTIETVAAEFLRMEKRGLPTPTAYGITGGRGLGGMRTLDISLEQCGRVAVEQLVYRCENPPAIEYRSTVLPGRWKEEG